MFGFGDMRHNQHEARMTVISAAFLGGAIGKFVLNGPCSILIGMGTALSLCLIYMAVERRG